MVIIYGPSQELDTDREHAEEKDVRSTRKGVGPLQPANQKWERVG